MVSACIYMYLMLHVLYCKVLSDGRGCYAVTFHRNCIEPTEWNSLFYEVFTLFCLPSSASAQEQMN